MSRKESKPRVDIYAKITDRIVAELEKGVRPWVQPWNAGNTTGRITRPLRHNGLPYQGINTLLLWSEAVARGFVSPTWMTFKQSVELGGHVRKGEDRDGRLHSRFTAPKPTRKARKSNAAFLPQGLYRVLRRSDRRPAGAVLRNPRRWPIRSSALSMPMPSPIPALSSVAAATRRFQSGARHRADAALRSFRDAELLRTLGLR